MKKYSRNLVFVFLAAAAAGCSTAGSASTDGGPQGTGSGGRAGGGGGSTGTVNVVGVALTPDPTGWVQGSADTKMIQGAWYGYGDHYGATGAPPGDCETKGAHPASDCSVITTPTLPAPLAPDPNAGFHNVGGKMCTSGTGAAVKAGTGGALDYSNMWGAGIALDLNNSGGANPVKAPYNATMNGVTGFAFDFENHLTPAPLSFSLRVEFPTMTSAAVGAAFWGGATDSPSPVVEGTNVVRWADVKGPFYATNAPPFDPTTILSMQFHIYTGAMARPFDYCISNVKALTN